MTSSASREHRRPGPWLVTRCGLCLRHSDDPRLLMEHYAEAHPEARPFGCDQCGRAFRSGPDLLAHRQSHARDHLQQQQQQQQQQQHADGALRDDGDGGDSPDSPPPPPRSSPSSSSTRESLDSSSCSSGSDDHQGTDPGVATDAEASSGLQVLLFGPRHALLAHLSAQQVDWSDGRIRPDHGPYECGQCHRRLGSSQSLEVHLKLHTGLRPFKCRFCPRDFVSKEHMRLHERVHTGERPYACTQPGCTKAYKCHNSRTVHVRTHTGERPYQCTECTSKFGDSSTLRVHIRTHTGIKPHGCTECDKRFSRKRNLAAHALTHAV